MMIKLHKQQVAQISSTIIDVDSIAKAIEKTERLLKNTTNPDAKMIWMRNMHQLKLTWQNAMVEIETNGKYNFFN